MTVPTGSAGRGRLAEVLATRGGRAEPEAPFVIEHREALIYMLCQAAELEHGIMCQYLFAAFSLKQSTDEGLTSEELEAVSRWRHAVAHVATEEMLHLALVQNVLSAIGAAPHLTRPNLPAPAYHYPAGVHLTLVPFGERALQHFMFLERPEGMALEGAEGIDAPVHDAVPLMAEGDIVPQLQDFATIGHLYRSIEHGLAHLADKFGEHNLFVGPPRAQATSTDFRWPELVAVTDLASAQRALDTILEQGEGARGHWEAAHFGQFVQILEEYRGMLAANPAADPVRRDVRGRASWRARRLDPPHRRSRDVTVHGSLQRQLRDPPSDPGAVLRAHGGDRRAACGAGARGRHSDGRRPQAARGADHDAAGRTGAPGAQRGAELRALLRGRRPPAASGIRPGSCSRSACAMRLAFCAAVKRGRRRTSRARSHRFSARWTPWRTRSPGTSPIGARRAAFATGGDGAPAIAIEEESMPFEEHIKPLFRERDRDSMRFAFDLWSLDDVSTHADAILDRLEAGTMPCDGAWPAERVAVFRRWIDAGKPA